MADAATQAVTEWDEKGNPVKPGASTAPAVTEWDEKGNPVTAPAAPAEHKSTLPEGSYQNRPHGPILNANETPSQTGAKRFLGAIGGLEPSGELADTTAGTFANIPKNLWRGIKSEWQQPTVGGSKGSVALPEDQATAARVAFPLHLAARGIEGIASTGEGAAKDIYQGIKRGDPRAIEGGAGEALGTIGQMEGTGAATELGGKALTAAAPVIKRIPPKLGLALRTEKGTLRPSVATVGRVGGTLLGTAAGHYSGVPGAAEAGGLAGALGGRGLMDAIVPARPTDIPAKGLGAPLPSVDEFYENRAEDLTQRGKEQAAIERPAQREAAIAAKEEAKAREAVPIAEGPTALEHEATRAAQSAVARRNARQFVPVNESPNPQPEPPAKTQIIQPGLGSSLGEPRMTGNEGRPATWTNEDVMRLARQGNREAIQQAIRRGMELPLGARYVMGDPDFERTVYNPRESTTFTPEGQPIRNVDNPTVPAPRARIAAPPPEAAVKETINAATGEVTGPRVTPPMGVSAKPNGAPPPVAVNRQATPLGKRGLTLPPEQRIAEGRSPTGVERRAGLADWQNAINETPPGQPTPGEQLGRSIREARSEAPTGITEGEAQQHIKEKGDAEWQKYKDADRKTRDAMLVKAKNELAEARNVKR